MHTEDHHRAITAMLAFISADHLTWWLTDRLNDFIADCEDEDLDWFFPSGPEKDGIAITIRACRQPPSRTSDRRLAAIWCIRRAQKQPRVRNRLNCVPHGCLSRTPRGDVS